MTPLKVVRETSAVSIVSMLAVGWLHFDKHAGRWPWFYLALGVFLVYVMGLWLAFEREARRATP